MTMFWKQMIRGLAACCLFAIASGARIEAQQSKPNNLVIWGDDIGQFNVSAYNLGMMGYKTPNIDQIGRAHV